MKKHIWIASAIVVSFAAVFAIPRLMGAAHQDQDEELRRLKGNAFAKGGLRAAAQVSGSYRQTMSPHGERDASTLEFLVKNSELIVIGQIRRNRAWLNNAGDTITTDYRVAVERALKGHAKPGEQMTMSVLGGRVAFPGGSWAQIDTPGMVPPLDNQSFILFLEPSDFGPSGEERAAAQGTIYMPAFASIGMYRIDGGVINPKTRPDHPLAKAYRGQAESALVNDVLDIIEKW
jgi:hypothetical protein